MTAMAPCQDRRISDAIAELGLEEVRSSGREGAICCGLCQRCASGWRFAGLVKHELTHRADCVIVAYDPVKESEQM